MSWFLCDRDLPHERVNSWFDDTVVLRNENVHTKFFRINTSIFFVHVINVFYVKNSLSRVKETVSAFVVNFFDRILFYSVC